MSDPIGVHIIVLLKEEARKLTEDAARGKFTELHEFARAQGTLFGVERALEICRRAVSEQDDDE